jgi:hypothetical protein
MPSSESALYRPQMTSFGLQILLFPFQALISGFGEELNYAFAVLYLPLLRGVPEFDVGCPVNVQATQFM